MDTQTWALVSSIASHVSQAAGVAAGVELLHRLTEKIKEARAATALSRQLEQFRIGSQAVGVRRDEITRWLRNYYSVGNSLGATAIRFATANTQRDLPLVTFPHLLADGVPAAGAAVLQGRQSQPWWNMDENHESDLSKLIAFWEIAGTEVWDDRIYCLASADETIFSLSSFLSYRATTGSLPDELAIAVGGLKGDSTLEGLQLDRRERYLPDLATLFALDKRPCAGGPVVLFAAQSEDGIVLLVQRRSNALSDESGSTSLVPKAFHQPIVSPSLEAELSCTVWRELYEELLGAEEPPSLRPVVHDYYRHNEALSELREARHHLQPLGLVWDLSRGNYHAAYCLFVRDQCWFDKHKYDLRMNWEAGDMFEPVFPLRRGDFAFLLDHSHWAPEAYFALIQGLSWLRTTGEPGTEAIPTLPELMPVSLDS